MKNKNYLYTIKNIYKVHYIVHERIKGKVKVVEHDETTIIDNLEYALSIFNDYKNKLLYYDYQGYNYYTGKAELFEPYIHNNGLLAYWSDNENYIKQYKLNL